MAEITNLNRFRKAKARDEKRKTADANAAAFGRSKAEKSLEHARKQKAERDLEGHRKE